MLLHFFSDGWTAVLIALIVLGTNYLQLTVWDGTLLTHTPLFLLYGLLLWATVEWHDRPRVRTALLLGAMAGLITLVRPSEGVCLLIPLLWLPTGPNGWEQKWGLLKKHFGQVAIAALAFIVAASPQLFYWHAVTGDWIFYSYVNPGEGFDFFPPYIMDFLFNFRKGWLLYTPLMGLSLLGIPLLWRKRREAFWAVLLFLLVDLWVISAWSCWWYAGGSFSSRSLVPVYVVLAIPLGICLQAIFHRKSLRWPAGIAIGLLVLLNLFQTWQWKRGILPKDRITKAYYGAIFGRTGVPNGAHALLMVERSASSEEHFTDEARYTGHELCHYTFDDRPDSSFHFTPEVPWTPGPDAAFSELTGQDHAWCAHPPGCGWATASLGTAAGDGDDLPPRGGDLSVPHRRVEDPAGHPERVGADDDGLPHSGSALPQGQPEGVCMERARRAVARGRPEGGSLGAEIKRRITTCQSAIQETKP
ncbi:MAG: hypothetical protein IPI95_01030 [Flavobacteriales bacterium]|nr:hypothetical protein [Flavobacteriales bacterium]